MARTHMGTKADRWKNAGYNLASWDLMDVFGLAQNPLVQG